MNPNQQHRFQYNLALLSAGSATVSVQQLVGSTYNNLYLDRDHVDTLVETYALYAGGYRYGFNGMEKDEEIKGSGNSYDFGNRMHDPRLGRFLSQDKFTHEFASETPYSFAGNSPILFIDMNGDFKIVIAEEAKQEKGAEIKIKRFEAIIKDLPNYLEQNPRVVDEIVKQTGLSKEQVMKDVFYGSGPVITIGLNNWGADAPNSNEISIDYTLIDFLEGYKGKTPLENAALDLIFAGIVLHEYTHVGDRKKNDGKITGDPKGDDPGPGKQKSTSKYNHRGMDVEAKVHGSIIPISGDVKGEYRGTGVDRDWYRINANFHIESKYIQNIMKRISLEKVDTQANPIERNALPKDQS